MSKSDEKKKLPAIRWEVVNGTYDKFDDLLCSEVSENSLTYLEIETVLQLMQLKILKSEVKHLAAVSLGEIFSQSFSKESEKEECYK